MPTRHNYKIDDRDEIIYWISDKLNKYGNKLVYTGTYHGHLINPQYYVRTDNQSIIKQECVEDNINPDGTNAICNVKEDSSVKFEDLKYVEISTLPIHIESIHLKSHHVFNHKSDGSPTDAYRRDFFIFLNWSVEPDLLNDMYESFKALITLNI